jgi:spore maturation protein CgeB
MIQNRIKRILYISETHPGPYPYVFDRVPDAIESLDYKVVRMDPERMTVELYQKCLDRFKPDVIFCFLRYSWAASKVATFLDQYHPVIALNWFQDDPNGVTREMLMASHSFDYWFTIDPRMVPFWLTKTYFMPPAFDECIYDDMHLDRVFDISYVGQLGHRLSTKMYMPYMKVISNYGKKAILTLERPVEIPMLPWIAERVVRKSRPILQKLPIWKCTWQNPRDEAEKAFLINRSKIHFGISRVRGFWEDSFKELIPDYPIDEHGLYFQIKPRVFHAVGCGTMVFNDYIPELEELFDIGKEIVTFSYGDIDEFLDKLAWYTTHDKEREKVARSGYNRGRKQHTFTARLRQILDIVGRGS